MAGKEIKTCKAPDANGHACKGKVLALGLCSKHYLQVYHHGRITNNPVGRGSEERDKLGGKYRTIRDRVRAELEKYQGKDAYCDIPDKLERQGFDKGKIKHALWFILRG